MTRRHPEVPDDEMPAPPVPAPDPEAEARRNAAMRRVFGGRPAGEPEPEDDELRVPASTAGGGAGQSNVVDGGAADAVYAFLLYRKAFSRELHAPPLSTSVSATSVSATSVSEMEN